MPTILGLSSFSTWTAESVRPAAPRKIAPATAMLAASVTIPRSCSSSSATGSGARCGPAERGRVARRAGTRNRAIPGPDAAPEFPRRRGLRQAARLQTAGGRGPKVHDPAARQSRLRQNIAWRLKRPVGRPAHGRNHASFSYRAVSWSEARRVVAKSERHPGDLHPRVGFGVTNVTRPAERVFAFYNQRGTAEQLIREGESAIIWTRLSCMRFAANAVRLHALAYNLAHFLRRWHCGQRSSTGR